MALQPELKNLINQYIDGNINEDEFKVLFDELNKAENTPKVLEAMDSIWNGMTDIEAISDEHKNSFYLKLVSAKNFKKSKPTYIWPLFAAAAVFLLVVSAAIFLWNGNGVVQHDASNIAPGKIGATLTLANGKKIFLGSELNGEVAKEAGVVITKSDNGQLIYKVINKESQKGQLNTLATAKGETYMVVLPDGSKVWLNAESSLTYYTNMDYNGKRLVKINGELYFEIAKDKAHPFVAEADRQQITVLGTHFNVNSYKNEEAVKTTLLEGSVRVTSPENTEIVLKPGQQSILDAHQIQVSEANVEEVIAWKNGYFRFNNENIQSVMKKISRWYGIEVAYEGEIPTDGFYGTISRSKNITEVLKMLEETKGANFKIEGRRTIVSKKY